MDTQDKNMALEYFASRENNYYNTHQDNTVGAFQTHRIELKTWMKRNRKFPPKV